MKNHMLVTCRHEQSLSGGKVKLDTWRWVCQCGEQDKSNSEGMAKKAHTDHIRRTQFGGK